MYKVVHKQYHISKYLIMDFTTRKMELLFMVSQGILLKQFSLVTEVILLVLAAATARQQSDWTKNCGKVDVLFASKISKLYIKL